MAQNGSGKRKQAPVYSADMMALRVLGGLALIVMGAMIFLAVDLRMQGNVFEGLKQVCGGLFGGMAAILPVLPVWAGVLVIWSTQRRAPVRPWLYALGAFIGLCVFTVLITRTQTQDYLSYLTDNGRRGWGEATQTGYAKCAQTLQSGGAAGVILAWPLWQGLGIVLGVVLVFPATLFCLLMMVNLTPKRIRALVTGQAGKMREQQQTERSREEQEQLQWQQEQARRRAEYEREQARIMEEQRQRAEAAQRAGSQGAVRTAEPARRTAGSGVEDWQNQATQQQAVLENTGHISQIFGRKKDRNASGDPGSGTGAEQGTFRSRLFRKKETYDGLSDGTEREQPARRPARTETPPRREAPVRPAREIRAAAENRRTEPVQEEIWEETPAEIMEETPKRERTVRREEREQDAYRPPKNWEAEQRKTEREKPAPAEEPARPVRPEKPERREEERVSVPAVQQKIGREAYQPAIKLPPRQQEEEPDEGESIWRPTPYYFPPITDLAQPKRSVEDTTEEDEMRAQKLEETLANFKVQAKVVHVTHGPAISRFELELAPGTNVQKVANLEKDIKYGMAATSVRVEAPIPGKKLVGVELPNRGVTTVTLREVLESAPMQDAKSILTVALGKDIAGTPIVCDLAKMPHMLIAGQTGSGKSVCINTIINSLLYRTTPDQVRLILVDPKVVELQCYNGIPHLLIPVVNDPHKAAAALAWAVAEMMERYDRFSHQGVRNLEGYNHAIGPDEKPMARIVIIIDELADLMMVCKKEVEDYIVRLTQLARAAGIHLIVATQRPSVDVITGLIKANIPSRIAFKTASYVDSRTILDRNGSEQLLGWGDMLYLPTGAFAPTRVQGCFLSDEEVNRIVKHVREANPSTYDPDILEKVEKIASGGEQESAGGADMIGGDMGGGDGSLFEQAVEYAIQDGQISTSTLQRRLKIGYARAGRLTDEMEERGIVAAKDGSKPRKCLITREEWEEMKQSAAD